MAAIVGDSDTDAWIEDLVGDLCGSSADASALLGDFARRYIRRIPKDYVLAMSSDELCARVRAVFGFFRVRRGADVAVRVFNPNRSDHGYEIAGAVIEVASPDMAFLVDSVTNELQRAGLVVEHVFHPVLGTVRGDTGELCEIIPARTAEIRESLQHFELDRRLTMHEAQEIEHGIHRVLGDVRRAVEDFEPMQQAGKRMIEIARKGRARYPVEEIDEDVAFLEWLLEDNFVFLGYREYAIEDHPDGRMISVVEGSGLGILSDQNDSRFARPVPIAELSSDLADRYEDGFLVVITKTNSMSRVHRPAKMDYIGVRHIAEDGTVAGEARLLGLFTSAAYMAPADTIPVLRRKLRQILEAEDTIVGSHHHKQVVQLFNSFLKDELFATPTEDIRDSIVGLIESQERGSVRLFVQRDLLQRNVSILVVMPRDRFNPDLRKQLQAMFKERFAGTSVDYRLSLGETDTARVHFTIWTGEDRVPDVSFEDLEVHVQALTRTWSERIQELLVDAFGQDRGSALAVAWGHRFPGYYRASTDLELAMGDIVLLDELDRAERSVVVGLQNESGSEEPLTRLSVYKADGRLELSQIMPTLEDFGLRVVEEVPTRLRDGEAQLVIHDFGVLSHDGTVLDLDACSDRVAATVEAVLSDEAESDSLSRLIILAGLDHRQVEILRAYRTYWQRVGTGFTDAYINDAFAAHPAIAADLVALFEARFGPDTGDWLAEARIVDAIADRLDEVVSLDEDRILRGFLGVILATLRTNAYAPGRASLAFKFDSANVPEMPLPAPHREIFVYAPDVEGVHLRGGRVARGGIRWSVRKEDYRTEVLELMKAQMTKNAVIVPTGSKGGFVLRRSTADGPSLDDVRAAYITFIRGLLDITDNLVDNEVVHPEHARIHDDADPYLVVAADRGTATFSDTANEIAAEYGYWLGDGFASGGSAGYDHKVLGITARGAWESVMWHLRELGIDPEVETFTVAGIGDMSGDVFGNGMLLSPAIKLVAAFDHRHVFIDPEPEAVASGAERRRLFGLPRSSWDDYDRSLISAGGGVWSRAAKSIDLTPEVQRALGVDATTLPPNEVIRAILRAPVDLLWNGGIGRYVKATDETNEKVGDRTNDAVRLNASELRCRLVAEGGNLGFTQRGRIEYANDGGRIYTDFIDNSGGVDCSDREVNLKVLLGVAEARGELERSERDELISQVAGGVVERVLYDNFLQAQILAQEIHSSRTRLEAYEDLMVLLESEGLLDRGLEYLPSSDEINDRSRSGGGLTGPELAVLLAYAKRSLRDWLVASELPDGPEFDYELRTYFPSEVVERFGHLIEDHPLRRELIATLVANEVVNSEGITFVSRMMAEMGATPEQVVRAYHVARAVTDADERWRVVERLRAEVTPEVGRDLLDGIDMLVESVARWHLTHPSQTTMAEVIERTQPAFTELSATIGDIGPPDWQQAREAVVETLLESGVPADVARTHAYQGDLAQAPYIIEVAELTGRPVRDVARVFLLVGPAFEIDWLEAQVLRLPTVSRWHRQAVQTVREDLVLLRRGLAERILTENESGTPEEALDAYLVPRIGAVARLARFVHGLAADGVDDVASVVVAIRRIRSLAG